MIGTFGLVATVDLIGQVAFSAILFIFGLCENAPYQSVEEEHHSCLAPMVPPFRKDRIFRTDR